MGRGPEVGSADVWAPHLVKQGVKVMFGSYRVVLLAIRSREKGLGLWMIARLVTGDGQDWKSAELERHTGVKSDLGSRCWAWMEGRV